MIEIEFKRVCFDKRLVTPAYGTNKAAALDLQAVLMEPVTIYPGEPPLLIGTGIAVNMMDGPDMAAMILPRSGLGHKKGLILGNSVGLIDQDYQGQLMVSAWNRSDTPVTIQPFERFAQLVVVPIIRVSLKEVEDFTATERGEGGFGSTGG